MEQIISAKYVVGAIAYSLLGLLILSVSFIVFDKLTPGNLWKEIILEKNLPLAITLGAMMLAIAQIISSAIHG
jgi:putative membrane protein